MFLGVILRLVLEFYLCNLHNSLMQIMYIASYTSETSILIDDKINT